MNTILRLLTRWRHNIHNRLFDIDTGSGKWVEFGLIIITLASVILVFVESSSSSSIISKSSYLFYVRCEEIFTAIFTLEYLLRLLSSPRPGKYFFSFFGIIDLITLLPIYVIMFFPGIATSYTMLFRLMRVLRILRMIKLMRYMNSAGELWEGLIASYRKLLVFFFIISVIICMFAGAMYVVEGPQNGFISLQVAFYWAAVTITTVGYGDITPHTALGRLLTSMLILIGYTIIAIPTGILSAHMTRIVQRKHQSRSCSHCGYIPEDKSARFCAQCGKSLNPDSMS